MLEKSLGNVSLDFSWKNGIEFGKIAIFIFSTEVNTCQMKTQKSNRNSWPRKTSELVTAIFSIKRMKCTSN